MKKKIIYEDTKIKEYLSDRKLSKRRINEYNLIFTEFQNTIKKELKRKKVDYTYLIEKAKQEQREPYKEKNGNIIYIDIPERSITHYLRLYYQYLCNETDNKESTIKGKISTIRTFYDEFDIKLPKNFKFNETLPVRLKKGDIPSLDDVNKGYKIARTLKDKALTLFIFTSGMRLSDVAPITIKDFLEATKEYHEGTLEDLLKQKTDNIIPTWEFYPEKTKRKGNLCITFNTPECVNSIFEYLNYRKRKNITVADDSPLFWSVVSPHFYHPNSLGKIFTRINSEHFNDKKDNLGKSFYRANNLRKLFLSLARNNISNASSKVDEQSKIDVVSVMGGHKPVGSSIKEVYEYADAEIFKQYYEGLIPYLSIRDTKVYEYKSKEIIKLENELNEFKKVLSPETLEALKKLK